MLTIIADLLFMVIIFSAAFALLSRTPRKGAKGTRPPEDSMGDAPGHGDVAATPRRQPSPAWLAPLAAGISFLAPGLGQFLIGARLRGLIWFVGWIGIAELSRAQHTPIVLVLMVVAAVDAYLIARSTRPDDRPAEGSG